MNESDFFRADTSKSSIELQFNSSSKYKDRLVIVLSEIHPVLRDTQKGIIHYHDNTDCFIFGDKIEGNITLFSLESDPKTEGNYIFKY